MNKDDLRAEVARLKTDNETLQRILSDLQTDSAAYLKGVEDGTQAALDRLAQNPPDSIRDLMLRPSVTLRPRNLELHVGSLEVDTDESGVHVRVDGVLVDGYYVNIRLWNNPLQVTWEAVGDERRRIAELRAEGANLRCTLENIKPPPGMDWALPDHPTGEDHAVLEIGAGDQSPVPVDPEPEDR